MTLLDGYVTLVVGSWKFNAKAVIKEDSQGSWHAAVTVRGTAPELAAIMTHTGAASLLFSRGGVNHSLRGTLHDTRDGWVAGAVIVAVKGHGAPPRI